MVAKHILGRKSIHWPIVCGHIFFSRSLCFFVDNWWRFPTPPRYANTFDTLYNTTLYTGPNSKKWKMTFCYFIEWTIWEREKKNNITTVLDSIVRNISTNRRIKQWCSHPSAVNMKSTKWRAQHRINKWKKFRRWKLKHVSTFVFILWFISVCGAFHRTLLYIELQGHCSNIIFT